MSWRKIKRFFIKNPLVRNLVLGILLMLLSFKVAEGAMTRDMASFAIAFFLLILFLVVSQMR